jgi:hypothetical protein
MTDRFLLVIWEFSKIKICTIIDLLFNIIQYDFKLQNNVLFIPDF